MKTVSAKEAAAALAGLMRVVEKLAYVPRKVAIVAAPKLSLLLRRGFERGQDPYGKPWKPLRPATVAKGRVPPPLTETGALAKTTEAKPNTGNRAGVRLLVRKPYGLPHQTGFRNAQTGKKVPARKILPDRGIPREWSKVLKAAAAEAFQDTLKGRP